MDPMIEEEIRAREGKLGEKFDDEVIDDVIAEVENLNSPESDVTANILRTLSGRD
jgi:hypothetical protein